MGTADTSEFKITILPSALENGVDVASGSDSSLGYMVVAPSSTIGSSIVLSVIKSDQNLFSMDSLEGRYADLDSTLPAGMYFGGLFVSFASKKLYDSQFEDVEILICNLFKNFTQTVRKLYLWFYIRDEKKCMTFLWNHQYMNYSPIRHELSQEEVSHDITAFNLRNRVLVRLHKRFRYTITQPDNQVSQWNSFLSAVHMFVAQKSIDFVLKQEDEMYLISEKRSIPLSVITQSKKPIYFDVCEIACKMTENSASRQPDTPLVTLINGKNTIQYATLDAIMVGYLNFENLKKYPENLHSALINILSHVSDYIRMGGFLSPVFNDPSCIIRPFKVPRTPYCVNIAFPLMQNQDCKRMMDEYNDLTKSLCQTYHLIHGLSLEDGCPFQKYLSLPALPLSPWASALTDVHKILPSTSRNTRQSRSDEVSKSEFQISIVQGSYYYCHYGSYKFDDKGWGCAYRSFQTIYSWFMLKGFALDDRLITHRDTQLALVEIGDRPTSFIGSRTWIGSIEIGWCLSHLLIPSVVSYRIINIKNIKTEFMTLSQILISHFLSHGAPCMIGGANLAHSILGSQVSLIDNEASWLVADPHYSGSEDLNTIIKKKWFGWKDASFWNSSSEYNLILPAIAKCAHD